MEKIIKDFQKSDYGNYLKRVLVEKFKCSLIHVSSTKTSIIRRLKNEIGYWIKICDTENGAR